LLTLHGSNETSSRTENISCTFGLRQPARVINHPRIPSLQFNHLLEFLKCFARRNQLCTELCPFRDAVGNTSQLQHPARQVKAQFTQILRPVTPQDFYNFYHFQCITNHFSEGLIHVGDQSHDLLTHALACFHHKFGKKSCILFFFHEG